MDNIFKPHQPQKTTTTNSVQAINLPEGTTKEEIAETFSGFGIIRSINFLKQKNVFNIKLSAIIEFNDPNSVILITNNLQEFQVKGVKIGVKAFTDLLTPKQERVVFLAKGFPEYLSKKEIYNFLKKIVNVESVKMDIDLRTQEFTGMVYFVIEGIEEAEEVVRTTGGEIFFGVDEIEICPLKQKDNNANIMTDEKLETLSAKDNEGEKFFGKKTQKTKISNFSTKLESSKLLSIKNLTGQALIERHGLMLKSSLKSDSQIPLQGIAGNSVFNLLKSKKYKDEHNYRFNISQNLMKGKKWVGYSNGNEETQPCLGVRQNIKTEYRIKDRNGVVYLGEINELNYWSNFGVDGLRENRQVIG